MIIHPGTEVLQSGHETLPRDLWAHAATLTLREGKWRLDRAHGLNVLFENLTMGWNVTERKRILAGRTDRQTDIQRKNIYASSLTGDIFIKYYFKQMS